jgi:hypothetical protein
MCSDDHDLVDDFPTQNEDLNKRAEICFQTRSPRQLAAHLLVEAFPCLPGQAPRSSDSNQPDTIEACVAGKYIPEDDMPVRMVGKIGRNV